MKEVNVMAFGAGVQTIALLIASLEGDYPIKPDFCVFGDPQYEHPKTYEALRFYEKYALERGVRIITGTNGNIKKDVLTPNKRSPTLPFWTEDGTYLKSGKLDGGKLLRQCTFEYKIAVVGKVTRKELGYKKGQVVRDHHVNVWLGISIDESQRMKESKVHWQTIKWPLIEMKWSRATCIKYIESKGLPVPIKSSCVICPFHNNATWRDLKQNDPKLWEAACDWDDEARRVALANGKIKSRIYVHKSMVPLRDANLEEDNLELWGADCAGFCGT